MNADPKAVMLGDSSTTAPTPWGVFFVASIAVFLVSMDGTLLYAAFGAVRAGFPGSTAADLSWVLNAYTVVYAALLVPAGRLVDARGRRRVFLAGLGIFLAASAGCGLAHTVETLVGARVAQAVGAALLTPSSLALVPPARFGVGSAVNQAVRQIGGVMGVSATVALVGHAGPRLDDFHTLYLTHVVLALLTAVLCLRVDTRPASLSERTAIHPHQPP